VAGKRIGRLGKGAHSADEGLEPSVATTLGQFRELRAVGFDHEEDSAPFLRLRRRWHGDGHQGAAAADQRG
jgi:hypothetical protein